MSEIPSPFQNAARRSYVAGDLILHEGEASDAVYLLESGQVEVLLEDIDHGELVLSVLGEGEIFGEMSLFSSTNQRCAMIRATQETAVRVTNSKSFLTAAEKDQTLWVKLTMQLANRLRDTNRRYSDRAFRDVKSRVARILVEQASRQGSDGPPVVVSITRTDLGRFANCTREAAGQAVLDLADEGLVTARGRSIELLDIESLEDY